ncbi:natural resistance-associated macrophage protein-domain-containing protein [Flammula alnicola]|nr:natural resistance-associated macrophage protein-domain-containing protein [Flammula alnicola]
MANSNSNSSSTEKREPANLVSTGFILHLKHACSFVIEHAKNHIGVGVVCAVAYFDPGNWGVDLQAGSQFGYYLLFIVLLAGLFAAYLQVLASRLGCVTGIDLASHTRLLLYNRPKHTLLYRWLGLYPLYVLAEIAIMATDLAELLGSAIALCLLFPKLELWHGVLITACDVIFVLGMGDPLRGKPVRMFELLISAMVIAILICMVVIISKVHVNWALAFAGYIPSKHVFASGGVYTSVGIIGATVMPHSLFLGSALATQDRPPASAYSTAATRHSERQNNSFEFIRAHIYHGTVDVVGSLLGFAVMINSLILMLASAVFFYGKGQTGGAGPASLFDAYDLIRDIVGKPAAMLFAIALLCSGQSSSLIATVAGQAVCEGFLQWRVSAVVRRLGTRLLAILPAMAVAFAMGRPGINSLLVASQVVLAIVLPFTTFPLLYCTSRKVIMDVRKTRPDALAVPATPTVVELPQALRNRDTGAVERADTDQVVDYSNGKLSIGVGVVIWLVIVTANMYVIVELGLGSGP